MNVLVVVPTYNERENLPLLARGVLAYPGFRMLIVDDGSPDGTGDVADALVAEYPGRVEVMHRTGKRGLGRSYIDGLRHAIASTDAELICHPVTFVAVDGRVQALARRRDACRRCSDANA